MVGQIFHVLESLSRIGDVQGVVPLRGTGVVFLEVGPFGLFFHVVFSVVFD